MFIGYINEETFAKIKISGLTIDPVLQAFKFNKTLDENG